MTSSDAETELDTGTDAPSGTGAGIIANTCGQIHLGAMPSGGCAPTGALSVGSTSTGAVSEAWTPTRAMSEGCARIGASSDSCSSTKPDSAGCGPATRPLRVTQAENLRSPSVPDCKSELNRLKEGSVDGLDQHVVRSGLGGCDVETGGLDVGGEEDDELTSLAWLQDANLLKNITPDSRSGRL